MKESIIDDLVRYRPKLNEHIKEVDAVINGGYLFEVARIYGKPLYVRLDHHDPARVKMDLAEIQSIMKSVVISGD